MRENIGLYHGKRKDNGEWVEGHLYSNLHPQTNKARYYILPPNNPGFCWGPLYDTAIEVDPDTVGECTGLTDKNGKLIFEGDIVAQNWYDFNEPADDSFGEVVFSVADCSFSVLDLYKNEIMSMGRGCAYHYEVEIIGNIYDNKELLNED